MSRARLRKIAMYCSAALILAFILVPLVLVFPLSLTSGNTLRYPPPGYSLRWYAELLSDDRWLSAFRTSLEVGLSSTALALFLGVPAAIAMAWGRFPGKTIVWAIFSMPIVTPVVIVGVAAYFYFSQLGMVGGRTSIVLIHAAMALPIVISTVAAALGTFDKTLLKASASLGAGIWRGFFQILLPLIAPGVMVGGIIAFIISFDEVVVASFLTFGPDRTLPRVIFSGVRENISPAVAAVSVLLMLFSAVLLALLTWLQSRMRRARSVK